MDCWATTPDAMPLQPSSRRRAPGKSGTDSGAASGLWALALSWTRHMAVATMLGLCKLGGEVEGCATAPKASSAAVSLRLGHLPPPFPPPPWPTQMGHTHPSAPSRQQRTRAAGRLVARPSPAWRLRPIPTLGKSHRRTRACYHAGAE